MVFQPKTEIESVVSNETQLRFYEIELYYAIKYLEEQSKRIYNHSYNRHAFVIMEHMIDVPSETFKDILRPQFKPSKVEMIHYFRYHGYSYAKINKIARISTITIAKHQTEYIDLMPLLPNIWDRDNLKVKWEAAREWITIFDEKGRYKLK